MNKIDKKHSSIDIVLPLSFQSCQFKYPIMVTGLLPCIPHSPYSGALSEIAFKSVNAADVRYQAVYSQQNGPTVTVISQRQ